jgi:hypothetical protein
MILPGSAELFDLRREPHLHVLTGVHMSFSVRIQDSRSEEDNLAHYTIAQSPDHSIQVSMYHQDPNTALEELTEGATLPHPVQVRSTGRKQVCASDGFTAGPGSQATPRE